MQKKYENPQTGIIGLRIFCRTDGKIKTDFLISLLLSSAYSFQASGVTRRNRNAQVNGYIVFWATQSRSFSKRPVQAEREAIYASSYCPVFSGFTIFPVIPAYSPRR